MKVTKAKGRPRDKSPKLKPTRQAHLRAEAATGDVTVTELAERRGVSRAAVCRAPVKQPAAG